MKVLVTGASGFIGKHLLKGLRTNYPELSIVATSTGRNSDFNDFCRQYKVENVDFIIGKSENHNAFEIFQRPDLLIHLAWPNLPDFGNSLHFENTLFEHYNFIKCLICDGLEELTVLGTCFEYGMKEGELSETMCTNPQNPYALAKDSLRRMLELLNTKYDFSMRWLRLFYLYGEGQSSKSLIPQLNDAINRNEKYFKMSKGDQLRDYLYIDDVIEIIIKTSFQNKITGIINCCSGKPIMIKDFVLEYLKEQKMKIDLKLGEFEYSKFEPHSFWGSTVKLKTVLNLK